MRRKFALQREKSWVNILIYCFIISWGILAIIFGFVDLQLSLLLVEMQSEWARWFADYGEIPGAVMVIGTLLIIDRLREPSGTKKDFLISILMSFTITLLIFRYGDPIGRKFELYRLYGYYFLPIIWLGVILLQNFLKIIESSYFRNQKNFARITVYLAIINPLVFVQSIKFLWGRVRFRDLAPDYSNYTPWYLPQGINGNRSFPSGHVAMGWMLLPLLLSVRDKNWKIKSLVVSGIIGWGVLVALGRIVIGAHYASDVLFSTKVALLSYLLLCRRYYLHLASNKELH